VVFVADSLTRLINMSLQWNPLFSTTTSQSSSTDRRREMLPEEIGRRVTTPSRQTSCCRWSRMLSFIISESHDVLLYQTTNSLLDAACPSSSSSPVQTR
jgi:hypothetical protein